MQARKLGIAIFVLIGLITASFVIAEMKGGLNVGNANAALTGESTLYVGGSGPNNYTKIQDAINAANDGDTVFVYSGTYYENVVINKRITLIGENEGNTIINGSKGYYDDVISSPSHVVIKNFTLESGRNGIICYPNTCIIENCTIKNNMYYGINIIYAGEIIVKNCTICFNGESGIKIEGSNDNIIENCRIFHNPIGILIRVMELNVTNNIIINNQISNVLYCGIKLYNWFNDLFL